jgi:anti-sigma factor RsiW
VASDDAELLAYVDGALSAREREAFERKLERSPDAALRMARLEASRLPYAQAFAHRRLPPVPASLASMVDGIARAARIDARRASIVMPGRAANDDAFRDDNRPLMACFVGALFGAWDRFKRQVARVFQHH